MTPPPPIPPSSPPNPLQSHQQEPSRKSVTTSTHFYAGAISGLVSCLALQPFDLVKTRLQQAEKSELTKRGALNTSTRYVKALTKSLSCKNMYLTASQPIKIPIRPPKPIVGNIIKHILKTEGVFGLWKGTWPTILRNVPGSALYFVSLQGIKQQFRSVRSTSNGNNNKNNSNNSSIKSTNTDKPNYHVVENLVAGAVARSAVGFGMMPFTIVKVRFESDMYRYKSVTNALVSIMKTEGIKGLFVGFGTTALRDAPYAGIYFVLYEPLRMVLADASGTTPSTLPITHNMFSAMMAGLFATTVTHPFDLMKTRLQLLPNEYKNLFHSVSLIYGREGLRGFFSGLMPRLLRKPASAAITWALYEEVIKNGKSIVAI